MRLSALCVCIFLLSSRLSAQSVNVRLPAEWEEQERVYLSWFGNDRRDSVLCRVVEALVPDVPVTVFIPADSLRGRIAERINRYTAHASSISLVVDPYADFWVRDPLFFVVHGNTLALRCFAYSLYGSYPDILEGPIPEDILKIGELDDRLAASMRLPCIKSDLVFEAGGIETNGKGTFLVIREMALQRNPGLSMTEIEMELERTLGAKKIIWLQDGLAEDKLYRHYGPFHANYFGGGANMHVDELCRFVDEHTVVLPYIEKQATWTNPVDSINHFMLERNYRILKKARTYEGKRLRIFRIPMPDIEQLKFTFRVDSSMVDEVKEFGFAVGDTIHRIPACSYSNYFVSNHVVLVPKYWTQGMEESQRIKDEEAKRVFQRLFPGRNVVQIYALSINRGGGGIHCMTHEQPAIVY